MKRYTVYNRFARLGDRIEKSTYTEDKASTLAEEDIDTAKKILRDDNEERSLDDCLDYSVGDAQERKLFRRAYESSLDRRYGPNKWTRESLISLDEESINLIATVAVIIKTTEIMDYEHWLLRGSKKIKGNDV